MQTENHDWRNPRTRLVASAAAAKCGVNLDAHASGSLSDDLKHRADLRRAVNVLRDRCEAEVAKGDGAAADKTLDEIAALGAFAARVDALIHNRALSGEATAPTGGVMTVDGKEAPVLHGAAAVRAHYARKATDAEPIALDAFLRGVAGGATTPAVRAALSEGTDASGGYAVGTQTMASILEALVAQSTCLQAGAGLLPLEGEFAKSFVLAAVDSVPTAAWRSEAGAVAESDPGFRAVTMTPRSLSFYFKVSRELLMDSANMETALATAIAQAMATAIDKAGLIGSGSAPEPRGIANTSGIIAVTNTANGASLATTAYANFMSAAQGCLEANAPAPTAYVMSPRSLIVLGNLLDTSNQPRQRPPMLDGVKFLASTAIGNALTVGTSSDCSQIIGGSFDRMVFALRERLSIQKAVELHAANGQVGFYCHSRIDIGVLYPKCFAGITGVRP